MKSRLGFGHSSASSWAMRSSYSTPAAFISAIFSVLIRSSCLRRTASGSSTIASTSVSTSSAYTGEARSSTPTASSRYSESDWFKEKSRCSSGLISTVRPRIASPGTTSMRRAWRKVRK